MATIVTSFDTVSKEFSVLLDDKKVKNISSVEFFGLGDSKAYCEMTTVEVSEDKDMVKVTRISADENIEDIQDFDNDQAEVAEELVSLAKFYR